MRKLITQEVWAQNCLEPLVPQRATVYYKYASCSTGQNWVSWPTVLPSTMSLLALGHEIGSAPLDVPIVARNIPSTNGISEHTVTHATLGFL